MSDTLVPNLMSMQPCPFCGKQDIRLFKTAEDEWTVECGTCEAELRWFSNKADAVTRWNTRTTSLSAGGPVDA